MNNLKDNPKYRSIIRTGKTLFWKYGIKRVSVEEICKEANVSKMTFYKFFPNKVELAKTIWHNIMKESLTKFRFVVGSDLSFQEKIKEMFSIKLEAAEDISVEFVTDIYKSPELGLQKEIEKYSQDSLSIFSNFLKDSQKDGLFRKEIKIEFILYYFNHMSQIFDDEELVSKYEHPHDLIMETMNFLFYGLSHKR